MRREPSYVALVLLNAVGPLAIDTYIAALPEVQRTFDTSPGTAQLTITMFIIGIAIGQLVLGPVSDAVGRRPMLLGSTVLFAVLSAACAIAPSAPLLLAARLAQGVAGGCGLVVGRAVISDRWSGHEAAARYGTLGAITLLAPIVAPGIGGLILIAGTWRDVFLFLAGIGLCMIAAVHFGVPETLPAERRHSPGLGATARRMGDLLVNRAFILTVLVQCLAGAAFFTYIGGSSFVLQTDLGLSAGEYTALFASNAVGMALMTIGFRLTVRRVGAARLRVVGVLTATAAAVALAAYALIGDAQLPLTWVLLAVVVAAMGLTFPATTAMAQEIGRATGGTAAALQGGLTFASGAASTPLTGLTGHITVAGMATIMAVLYVLAAALLAVTPRVDPHPAEPVEIPPALP